LAILEYDIRVIGRRALEAEFASIERRLAQHNATVARTTGTSATRVRSGSTGSTVANEARAAAAAQRQQSRETANAAVAAARAKAAAEKQAARDATLAARSAARAEVAAKRQAAKESATAEKQALREVASLEAQQRRQQQYWHRARSRSEQQRHRDEQRSARQSFRESRREAQERSGFIQSTLGGTAGRVGRTLSSIGTIGLATAGLGGTALAASAIGQATKLDEGSRRLAVQGRNLGESGANADDLRRQFTRTGVATGLRPEDVMAGAQAYVTETGDLGTAMANLKTFATTAQAAGASVEDIARAAAHMQKIGVTSVDDMQKALATLTMQGKKGSYELRAMAVEFPEIMANAAKLGITGVGGITKLGGFLQVVQKATGNASETTTASSQFFNQLIAKSDDLASGKSLGGKVNVFSDKGKTKVRDFRDLIGEVLVASGGNIEKLNDTFEIRGSKAFNQFTSTFNDTRAAALKGGASDKVATEQGRQAAVALLDNAANVPGDFREIERDAADAMRSFSVQMGIVQDQLKDAVSSELFGALRQIGPDISKLVMPVRTLTRVMVEAARLLANNPFAGLGAIIAVQLAADIAKARIGDTIRGAIDRASGVHVPGGGTVTIPGQPTSGPAGKAPTTRRGPTIMDGLGAAATGAAVGITIGTAILTAGVVNFQAEEAAMNVGGERVREALGGDPTQQDSVRLRELLNKQREETERSKRDVQGRKDIEGAFDIFSAVVAPQLAAADWLFGGGVRSELAGGLSTAGGLRSETAKNTSEGFEKQIEGRLTGVERLESFAVQLEKAGASQESAAKQLAAAAEKLGLVSKDMPSRTAAASTPKT
jgi:hypothetical protein